jgi:tetratricopeptide (TPR) repeat protein
MKRTIPLWLGLLVFALLPAFSQAPNKPMGKIHGHVTNPTGSNANLGTVSLSNDGGHTSKYTFPVSEAGDYAGEALPGTYTIVFRLPDTPPDKVVDIIEGVKVVAGQDLNQDIDMSRKEFIDKLSPEAKKQLEELKKHNAEALKANEVIKNLNADIKLAAQDFHEAGAARVAAAQALGASAAKADLDAKEAEIKAAKYAAVETMMLKDTAAKTDASILWMDLGQAQLGLKKYDVAEVNYKKALDVEAAAKKPNPEVQSAANAGLGEIYARTGKVPEANAAYDAAAKIYPPAAGVNYKNEAVIFYQMGNLDAQAAAADQAITADPSLAIAYYLKGQGLIAKATVDAAGKYVLPPGCAEAYQKYIDLAPNGPYAGDAKAILAQSTQKVTTTYKAGKK